MTLAVAQLRYIAPAPLVCFLIRFIFPQVSDASVDNASRRSPRVIHQLYCLSSEGLTSGMLGVQLILYFVAPI